MTKQGFCGWVLIGVIMTAIVLTAGCTDSGPPVRVTNTPTPTATSIPTPTATSTPTQTPTPIPTPSPTPVLKTVLFSDDLSKWRSEWESVYDGNDGKTFYSGGSLHIRDNAPTGTMYHTLNKNYNDFILDVDSKAVAGTIDNWQGVNVRENGEETYYGLSISADGYYAIVKAKGNIQSLTGPTRSSYINTGIGAINHIHCEVNNNTLSLSVNGHHLSTVTDSTFDEGTISLKANCKTANSFSEVVYNNLVITSIN